MSGPAPVAIITGAGRGIGRATARELASLGYRLSLAARDAASLDETAALVAGPSNSQQSGAQQSVAQRSGACLAVPTDVTDPAQVDRLVRQTLERFGRVDAVVNNAGLAPVRSIADM